MPKMDGFELYIKIREKDPKVKICFLTAIAMINEELRKTRSEITKIIDQECVIQKPIKTEDLIRKLTSIMNINMITYIYHKRNNHKVSKIYIYSFSNSKIV
jgi:CheY-like chemotaxis protein